MFMVHSQLSSGKLTCEAYLSLSKRLSDEYSAVVDNMNNGLNNYYDLVEVNEDMNNSRNWSSSLSLEGSRQPACVKDFLAKARQKSDAPKTMKISFSKHLKRKESQSHFGNENSQSRNASRVNSHLLRKTETNDNGQQSFEKHVPSFGKRKLNNNNELEISMKNKKAIYTAPTKVQHRDIDSSSYQQQLRQEPENYVHPGKIQTNVRNGMDQGNKETKRNPFLTARDQLIIDQKKSGKSQGNSRDTTSSMNYGGAKKSLGTRRGLNSKFVPPVGNQETNERNESNPLNLDPKYENCDWMKNIDPKMIELIENEIMEHCPGITWDDIAGLDFAKNTIQEIVIWPMLRPDIFTGLRGPPKGLLLFGPPGTGKTLIGKCIASQSNATFFSISASSLTSKWIGEGEKMVRALFGVARCQQPAVIFIDEIDSLLTQRSDSEHESSRRIKTEFLVQLDGATSSGDDRLLVVGATNRPQELDEAARRRLVKRLYIPLPEATARRQIIENLMMKQSNDLLPPHLDDIMGKTTGYSGADMANLCREAALGPIRSIRDIKNINADDVRPVNVHDFEVALKLVRPSVSQQDLQTYKDWNRQYGSGGGEPP